MSYDDTIHYSYDYEFIINIKNYIPNSVKYLVFNNNFNQEIVKGNIPHGVKHLNLGNNFNSNVHYLPNSIETLILATVLINLSMV